MPLLFQDEEIHKTANFTISQDWETPIPGFIIISSNRLVRSISDLNDQEAAELIELTIKVRKGMKEVLNIENVYLFQNEDTKHNFHLWLFPRHEWMNHIGNKIESVRKIMNYAEEWTLGFNHNLQSAQEQFNTNNSKEKEKIIQEVRLSAAKMREYMKNKI